MLKRHRLAAGLTQEALAERAGVSARAVSALEGDQARLPRLDSVALLATALGLGPEQHHAFLTAARPVTTAHTPAQILPVPPTPLIGREGEVAAALALLRQEGLRLLTLTGPGGTGKTRLAQQLAVEASADFPDGVFFVPLAALTDPVTVAPTLAGVLGIKDTGGRPLLLSLQAALRDRQLLLVLDNFEQVLPAAPLVAELLAAAPRLVVLVTSRVVLRLVGEQRFPVPPLALPNPADAPAAEQAARYAAIKLFLARARASEPAFTLTPENVAAVVAICCRLDGLPLALELAAARVRLLPPRALLARLEPRLALLTGGPQDAPARQRTLRATLDWSYDLLTPAERALLARLAVFAGGGTLDAIEVVCGTPGAGEPDTLEGVDALVRASLVQQEDDNPDESRFGMLETIREYALERLAASGAAQVVRQAHTAYYLTLAEAAVDGLRGPTLPVWVARLAREHDNLRAALRWALNSGSAATALRLVGALRDFWSLRGYQDEGRAWAAAALARSTAAPPAARVAALLTAGRLAHQQGDRAVAAAAGDEAHGLAVACGDRRGEAEALDLLADNASRQGDPAAARPHVAASLALWQALDDRLGFATTLLRRGEVARAQGDLDAARADFAASLALSRAVGHLPMTALALHFLAVVDRAAGDLAAAQAHARESLALHRALDDRWLITWVLDHLGHIELCAGDLEAARPLLEEALAGARAAGDTLGLASALVTLALLARGLGNDARAWVLLSEGLALGEPAVLPDTVEQLAGLLGARGAGAGAARLYGAAAARRATTGGLPRDPAFEAAYRRDLAAARAGLDAAAWDAAWAAGQALPLAEAVAEVLAVSASDRLPWPASTNGPVHRPCPP